MTLQKHASESHALEITETELAGLSAGTDYVKYLEVKNQMWKAKQNLDVASKTRDIALGAHDIPTAARCDIDIAKYSGEVQAYENTLKILKG